MIKKKFVKHGNSRALVVEKTILDMLNIEDETEVTITTDGVRLIVSPIMQVAQHPSTYAMQAPQQHQSIVSVPLNSGYATPMAMTGPMMISEVPAAQQADDNRKKQFQWAATQALVDHKETYQKLADA